jgi:hypothetical protein
MDGFVVGLLEGSDVGATKKRILNNYRLHKL